MVVLSILIPVYNEEDTLEQLVNIVQNANLQDLKIDKELIIVDDGSTDGSYNVMCKLKSKYSNVKIFQHRQNQGKGAGIKTAIKEATGDILIVQDADLEYNPDDYYQCIKPILDGNAKVIYGSRRLKKENTQYSGLSFYLGGVVITWAFNILFFQHISDEPTCYKTFHKDVIKNIIINGNGFEWEPEVTAKIAKQGIKIYEVPISYFPRNVQQGKKIKFKDGFKAIWTLIKYRFVN